MLGVAGLCMAIAGCGGQPIHISSDGPPITGPVAIDRVADAQVRAEHIGKAGNPASYVVYGRRYFVMHAAEGFKERGHASWYGRKFHGRKTSNGETYDMYKMTAAHKTLPIPSYVRVTNLDNNKQAIVRVNDRGPFKKGRIIDLSYTAAWKLGIIKHGTAPVEIEVVTPESLEAERLARQQPRATPAVQTRSSDSQPAQTVKVSTSVASSGISNAVAAVPATLDSGWYLQAGAFEYQDNARLMEDRLRRAGLIGQIATQRLDALYRVRLGPYPDQTQLAQDHQRLQALGIEARTIEP